MKLVDPSGVAAKLRTQRNASLRGECQFNDTSRIAWLIVVGLVGWLPCVRRDRPLRAAAHLRAYPRRHRGCEKTRSKTWASTARSRDGFGGAETHRSQSVARSSGKTARNWPGNGLQTRRRNARRSFFALNVILGTNGHGRAHRPPRTMKMDCAASRRGPTMRASDGHVVLERHVQGEVATGPQTGAARRATLPQIVPCAVSREDASSGCE